MAQDSGEVARCRGYKGAAGQLFQEGRQAITGGNVYLRWEAFGG